MRLRTPGRDIHIFLYFPLSIALLSPVFGLWSLSQVSLLGTVKGLISYPTFKPTSESDLVHEFAAAAAGGSHTQAPQAT